jgi:hypothetical protein
MVIFKECTSVINSADLANPEEESNVPDEISAAMEKYLQNNSDILRAELIGILNKNLAANFVFENISGGEELLKFGEDLDAVMVEVMDFDPSEGRYPIITARAIFKIPFRSDLGQIELSQWEEENDQQLADAVNFYWKAHSEGENLFLNAGYGGISFEIA